MVRAPRLSAALAAAAALVACACGAGPEDGARRSLVLEWPNGTVRIEGEEVLADGVWRKDGDFVFYDDEGAVTHRGAYEDGLETGPWTERYGDGGQARGSFFRGQRHGEWVVFHPNGKLAERGRYDLGKRVGTWERWSRDGEPRPARTYE